MALIRPIQPTFGGGEVSPAIYARIDINKYKSSLRTCRNFIVQPHGGVSNRPGTRFVAETKDSTKESIVQDFIFNEDQSYILEFGDEYIRFYTNGARVSVNSSEVDEWSAGTTYVIGDYVTLAGGTVYYANQTTIAESPDVNSPTWTASSIYEEPSPYLEADLQDLRFESSADVIYITHPLYQPRTLSRFGATDFRLALYDPQDGPFAPENLDDSVSVAASAVTGSVSLSAQAPVFTTTDVGALFRMTHFIEGQASNTSFTSATSGSSIKAFTTWRLITHGTWTAEFDIEKSTDSGVTWSTIRSFTGSNDFNVNTSGTEDPEVHTEPFLVRVTVTSYTSGTMKADLSTDSFFQDGILDISAVHSLVSATATVVKELGLTTNTVSWAHGAWSGTRGYPAVSRFYKDRLCFAATTSEPQTLWMSQTGVYNSFFRHSILLDTDGITINLPSRQINQINGLIALTRLIVLTNSSEWSVGPGPNGILTPTSIDTRVEGYRGSSGLNPVVIGNEAVYIQTNAKTIRSIGFELASESFTGADMSILAKHLLDNWTIVDIAYQQDPDSVIWFLRDDGILLGITYMAEQEVLAMHWHDTGLGYNTDGSEVNDLDDIESIAVIPNTTDNFDEVYMVVNRDNGRFIERMARRITSIDCGGEKQVLIGDQIRVDSAISYDTDIGDTVSFISSTSPIDFTLTSPHGFSTGDVVAVSCAGDFDGSYTLSSINPSIITNYWPMHGLVNSPSGANYFGYGTFNLGSLGSASPMYDMKITRMYVNVATAPGVGTRRKFIVYKNGVPTNLSVTLSDLETTGNTTATVTFDADLTEGGTVVEELIDGATDSAFSVSFVMLTTEDKQPIIRYHEFDESNMIGNGAPSTAAGNMLYPQENIAVIGEIVRQNSLISSAGNFKNFRSQVTESIQFAYPISNPNPGNGFYPASPSDNVILRLDTYDLDESADDNNVLVTYRGTETEKKNLTDTWAVDQTQFVSMRWTRSTGSGLINVQEMKESIDFFPTNAGHRIYDCHMGPSSSLVNNYSPGIGGTQNAQDLTTETFSIIPTSGTIKNLIVSAGADTPEDPANLDNPMTVTFRKNGADTALTATLGNDDSNAQDLVNSFTVVAGDLISISAFSEEDPLGSSALRVGWTFVSDNVLETPVFLSSMGDNVTANAPSIDTRIFTVPGDASGNVFTSGGILRSGNNEFTGLDHLNGEKVSILGDGKPQDYELVVDGSITTSSSFGQVHIGLPYASDLETLDIEIGSDLGTAQGSKIKVGNIIYRFVDSNGGYIGPDETDLYEAFTTSLISKNASELAFKPDYYDFDGQSILDPDPFLYTGDLRRPLGGGYKTGGRSFFRQIEPLPVNITAIIPEIKGGGPV